MKSHFNKIFYSKVGHGPHLCFLHGFCENSSIWKEVIDDLKASYTCTSVDLPGFGLSKDLSFESIPAVVSQLKSFLDGLGIKNPILLGHSMGGYVVAEYINCFGSELQGAAFIHSTSKADSTEKKRNRDKIIEFVQKNGGSKFFPSFIQGLVSKDNFNQLNNKLLELVKDTPDTSIIEALNAMKNRKDSSRGLVKFNKPVLFLRGAEDNHYLAEEIYEEVSQCTIAQLDEIEAVGHLSMFENKKKCLKSIKHFLNYVELTT